MFGVDYFGSRGAQRRGHLHGEGSSPGGVGVGGCRVLLDPLPLFLFTPLSTKSATSLRSFLCSGGRDSISPHCARLDGQFHLCCTGYRTCAGVVSMYAAVRHATLSGSAGSSPRLQTQSSLRAAPITPCPGLLHNLICMDNGTLPLSPYILLRSLASLRPLPLPLSCFLAAFGPSLRVRRQFCG